MQVPEWVKPGVWGAIIGVVAMAIVAFSAGWIVTSGGAQEMAEREAERAVVAALTPVCVAKFKQLAETQKTTHLAALDDEGSSYQRSEYVEDQGWATLPGTDEPNDEVADACAEELMKLSES